MDVDLRPATAAVPAVADGTFRIALINWCYGGVDGGADRRWQQTVDVLRATGPHVVLCQEFGVPQPALRQSRYVQRTSNALGMQAVLGPVPPGARSALHTAILVDTRTTGWRVTDTGPYTHTRFGGTQAASWCVVELDIPGLPLPLHCVSVHLPARSAVDQLSQAQMLAALIAAMEGLVLVGGDINTYPRGGPPVTTDELECLPPHLRVTRCWTGADGRLQANHDVDDVFVRAGLLDIAAHLPADRRTPPKLRATGKGGARVDRAYGSPELLTAATGYWQVGIGSDHDGVIYDISSTTLRRALAGDELSDHRDHRRPMTPLPVRDHQPDTRSPL
ncbi:endonuclease/exonuclease/phosphatase family protein [Actinomadura sp. 3N508]|uniref:endonuclease/exonuclease/phosphatase family protein n=1 Tax=Actinomadura sp. 3N508 TaxID=3375153 RepID=UPI0037BCE3E6